MKRAAHELSPSVRTRSRIALEVALGEVLQALEEHVLLGREVVVDGCRGHVRGGCDVGNRHVLGWVQREQSHRRIDDR